MASRNPFAETLTPENAAVLLIDYQTALFQYLPSVEALQLKNTIISLAKVARTFDLPVLLSTHGAQEQNGPILPELVDLFPGREVIERDTVMFWENTACAEAVARMNRKKLIVSALDTTICLPFAAIDGVQRGYDIYAVMDASFPFDELDRQAAMIRMSSAGVVVATWGSILAELAHNRV
jgi:nicotinamidase-related amidase